MRGTQVILCVCCGLEQHAPVRRGERPPICCLRCEAHRGHSIEQTAARETEHANMRLRALLDTQDDVLLARGERDYYRDRMHDAYETRETLLSVLARVDAVHHRRGDRCSCGKRGCHIPEWISDPQVQRLIRHYDEEQRTLRELYAENPDGWVDQWDHIDVTLVYPKRRPMPGPGMVSVNHAGRHRANG